ncbi:TPA: hypothetical protein PCX91_002744 [Escherichia coli]|nr:hypothetical protein [Escherichia coli]
MLHGIKLIDILLRELPKRGGWPSEFQKAVNDCAYIRFESTQCAPIRPLWSAGIVDPSFIEEVTRQEYESALVEILEDKRDTALGKLTKMIGCPAGPYAEVKAAQIYDAIKSGDIVIE